MSTPVQSPSATGSSRRCLMTGSSGYVGSRIKARLHANGWNVTELVRNPASPAGALRYQLGEAIAPEKLAGHSALVHCAYDFRQISWEDIFAVNVRGSALLLAAAKKAGVGKIVFISSISAYDGCRSLYGQAKLEIERITSAIGGWNIRPGLVYGDAPGAMFGRVVQKAQSSRLIPLPGGGRQRQYLVHDADLCAAVCSCLEVDGPALAQPVTVAHPAEWTLRELLAEIARGLGKSVFFFPVPWRVVWAGLRLGEKLRLPLEFRSDSLVSLVHQNPSPVFNSFQALGVECRPFEFQKLVVASRAPLTSGPATS